MQSLQPRLTPMVKNLLIVLVAVYLLQNILRTFAGIPVEFLFGFSPVSFASGYIWQILTYPLLHGSIWHILFNSLMLYMLGSDLETRWGSRKFLKYFAVTAIGGALLQSVVWMIATFFFPNAAGVFARPIIGASGALYGLLMAFALIQGDAMVLVGFLVPMKVKHFVMLLASIDIISAVFQSDSGVAHLVHLGGLITGYLYLKLSNSNRSGGFFSKKRMGRAEMKKRLSVISNDEFDKDQKSKYPITWN